MNSELRVLGFAPRHLNRSTFLAQIMIDFSLWAECESEASLNELKVHFSNFQHTFLTGRTLAFSAVILNEEVLGLSVGSTQLCKNGRGIESLNDALEVTEAGIVLYHRLQTAPDFRFAHVDWNADLKTSEGLSESVEIMDDGRRWMSFRCAVNDELYKQIGTPASFWQFREGYWWRKYRGETYMPLFSSDQKELLELSERLLPKNLDWEGKAAW